MIHLITIKYSRRYKSYYKVAQCVDGRQEQSDNSPDIKIHLSESIHHILSLLVIMCDFQ